jgi:hypothetical protein
MACRRDLEDRCESEALRDLIMEKRRDFVSGSWPGDPACSSNRGRLSAELLVFTGGPAAVGRERNSAWEGLRGICSLARLSA